MLQAEIENRVREALLSMLLLLSGCLPPQPPAGLARFGPPPFEAPADTRLGRDIAYGDGVRTRLDVLLPAQGEPTPLVIYFHGGGFISGDKSSVYKNERFLRALLEKRIAVASVNYAFLDSPGSHGVESAMSDGSKAHSFLDAHASDLNLDLTRVVLMGSSAGGGMALWLSLSEHPPSGVSYRPVGVVAVNTQATYDLKRWEEIFATYQFSTEQLKSKAVEMYALSSFSEFSTSETLAYRARMDMLAALDADDPPLWIGTENAAVVPVTAEQLFHHPLHVKALQERAQTVGLTGVFRAPALGLEAAEDELAFIRRVVGR